MSHPLNRDEAGQSLPALALSSAERDALVREFSATIDTLLARNLHRDADALAQKLTELLPDEGLGWKMLAYGHLRSGQLAAAQEPLRRATALLPQDTEVANHLAAATAWNAGLAAAEARRHQEAATHFQTVRAIYPQHADAHHRLAVSLLLDGNAQDAVPLLETAIGINPDNGQYWANYIDALIHTKQTRAAWIAIELGQKHGLKGPIVDSLIDLLRRLELSADYQFKTNEERRAERAAAEAERAARESKPIRVPTKKQLESIANLYNARDFGKLEKLTRALVKEYPRDPLVAKGRGVSLYILGRLTDALPALQVAYELNPRDFDVLHTYAATLEANVRHKEAYEICKQLNEHHPDHREGRRLRALIETSLRMYDEAERSFARAMEVTDSPGVVAIAQGTMYVSLGRLDDAVERFRFALEHSPDEPALWSNMLFTLDHDETVEPQRLFAEHRRFGEHFEPKLRAQRLPHTNTREPNRTLRIGILSGDFRGHAVASFLLPTLPGLASDPGLTLYAYSNTPGSDSVTERLRSHFAHWRDICMVDDDTVVKQMRSDRIDILIDLSGHTNGGRTLVLARKPAPVQATWIGYPGTTGLTAVDYFIGDRFWVPDADFRSRFTEKIAYLPAVAPFHPEPLAPPVNALPSLANGYVTFGSFNRLEKIRRNTVALWARLLRALPDARLQLGAMPGTEERSAQTMLAWFAEEGIARERLDLRPRGSIPVFLQQHYAVDVCLDTFPYGGLTTALQSLWMGVPTLTLAGRTVPGRSGSAVMGHAGLEQFIATDPDDFVRRGVAVANDVSALAELRATMRERSKATPMFQPDLIAQNVSRALRTMWRRWCADLPAETFDVSAQQDL